MQIGRWLTVFLCGSLYIDHEGSEAQEDIIMNKRLSAIQNVSLSTLLFETTNEIIVGIHDDGRLVVRHEDDEAGEDLWHCTLGELLEHMATVTKDGEIYEEHVTVIESVIN